MLGFNDKDMISISYKDGKEVKKFTDACIIYLYEYYLPTFQKH